MSCIGTLAAAGEADEEAGPVDAKAIAADEVEVKVADEAEANEAEEVNESDDADEVENEADDAKDAGDDEADEANEVDKAGVSIDTPLLLPFSLTKYSAIFSEVKESFGVNNNQLLGFGAAA
jgi:hypothetical protein